MLIAYIFFSFFFIFCVCKVNYNVLEMITFDIKDVGVFRLNPNTCIIY